MQVTFAPACVNVKRRSKMREIHRRISTAWLLGTVVAFGCAADAVVLSSNQALEEQDAGASPPWLSCDGDRSVVERGRTGDECSFGGMCFWTRDYCGVGITASCQQGRLSLVEYETLGCDAQAPSTIDPNAPVWDDCQNALTNGQTDDFATRHFSCARLGDDPCCADVATTEFHSVEPEILKLVRTRVCQLDCERVQPDLEREPVTDCASLTEPSPDNRVLSSIGRPCSGDLMCTSAGLDLSGDGVEFQIGTPGGHPSASVRFCSQGRVLGQL
jgi:hypothetical protein